MKTATVTQDEKAATCNIPVSSSEEERRERVRQAIQDIREIRKRTKPVSLAEILSARDEGRK